MAGLITKFKNFLSPNSAGGGDADGCNFSTEAKNLSWHRLPMLVKRNILKYCDEKDLCKMRQTCHNAKYMIDTEVGIQVILPARNFAGFSTPPPNGTGGVIRTKQITDRMVQSAVLRMETKIVRILEMNEMPPGFNPFPFERFVKKPWRLEQVRLKYVDINLIHKVFMDCRNLSSFYYETGLHRPLPQGPLSMLLLFTSFQPTAMPAQNDQLIQVIAQLPAGPFQVANLSSLTLCMNRLSTFHGSDWANPLYLMLAMSSSTLNLNSFKFILNPRLTLVSKDLLQILGIIGQFLSKCGNLQHFEYTSTSCSMDMQFHHLGSPLPQNVLSFLITRYGTATLQRFLTFANGRNVLETVQPFMNQLMGEAGRSLRQLRDVTLDLNDNVEARSFKGLLENLKTVRNCKINEKIDFSWRPFQVARLQQAVDLYNFLLLDEAPLAALGTLEKLQVSRYFHAGSHNLPDANWNRSISLNHIMRRFPNIKSLEITPACGPGKPIVTVRNMLNVARPNAQGRIVVNEGFRTAQVPDVTIGPEDGPDDSIFQRVEVLKLNDVKLLNTDVARLAKWSNLREIYLKLETGYRHQHYGMKSQDLLEIISSLRRLDKLEVNSIFFPPDDLLREWHALNMIGSLQSKEITFSQYGGLQRESLRTNEFIFDFNKIYVEPAGLRRRGMPRLRPRRPIPQVQDEEDDILGENDLIDDLNDEDWDDNDDWNGEDDDDLDDF